MKVTNSDFKAICFRAGRYGYEYSIWRDHGLWSAYVITKGVEEPKLLCKRLPKARCIAVINEHIKLYGEPEK